MKHSSVLISFVIGATLGALGSWYFAKKKYEFIAQEEIDSVKERFKVHVSTADQPKKEAAADEQKNDFMTYAKQLKNEGYVNYSSPDTDEDEDDEIENVPNRVTSDSSVPPYVIAPEHFDEFDDYTVISLMYYADGTLADDDDQILKDVANTVGSDAVEHFGEYDDDCVYVRNERLKVDYEILRSLRTYDEVVQSNHI